MQNKCQGVNIRPCICSLHGKCLRCHVGNGALEGHNPAGLWHTPGDTEITQFEKASVIDKNILRLDITVDDTLPMQNHESLCYIRSHFQNQFFRQWMANHVVGHGSQQLHADQDIPADLALMLIDQIILIRYDIGIADEFLHDSDFIADVIDLPCQKFLCSFRLHPFRAQLHQVRRTGRDMNDLQSRFFQMNTVLTMNLIDSSETTGTNLSDDFPSRPNFQLVPSHFRPPTC